MCWINVPRKQNTPNRLIELGKRADYLSKIELLKHKDCVINLLDERYTWEYKTKTPTHLCFKIPMSWSFLIAIFTNKIKITKGIYM